MSLNTFVEFISPFGLQVILSLLLLLIYLMAARFATPRLTEGADQGNFKEDVASRAISLAKVLIGFTCLIGLGLVWGVEFTSIFVFLGTTITLLGVAFFASWSLLSNVTAYFILLLHPTFRRGTFIRIIDADNYIEGYISDITMFNMKLISETREVIVYPNSLILARPAIVNPRDKRQVIGKIVESAADIEASGRS